MHFLATADTDIGISKKSNQDSLLIKHAKCDGKEILMAIVCDGMGGLNKGEVASATVIRRFAAWFDEDLPYELEDWNINVVGGKWALILKELNSEIMEQTASPDKRMGTTFTGMLLVDEDCLIVHVGDSRAYKIKYEIEQLTEDHTFVQREVKLGHMTREQATIDKRRNLLLQCVGASDKVEPDVIVGRSDEACYLLCSDGFRHEISEQEMFEYLRPENQMNKKAMHSNVSSMIELVKSRQEKDNISAILVKAEQ